MIRFFDGKQHTCAGDRTKIVYSSVVRDDGVIELVESGKEDWQGYIESSKDEADINVIINKFVNGDISVLNQRNGIYGDFTQMPKTYAEMLQKQIDATNAFYKLSPDVREKFNNDVNQFFATAGSEEWLEKLGYSTADYMEKVETPKVETSKVEVKE